MKYIQSIKKIASYIWDIPIEKTSSAHNEYLEVVWSNGRKMLNTREANFSFGNGYKVFAAAMKEIEAPIGNAQSTLVLGFGCGSILHLLEKKYNYTNLLVGVEYDPEILRLYQNHFSAAYKLKPELCSVDAQKFVATNEHSFDVVFVDLFHELDNSPLLSSEVFLECLITNITKEGVLVFNTTTKDKVGQDLVFELQMWLSSNFKTVTKTAFQEFNQILIAYN